MYNIKLWRYAKKNGKIGKIGKISGFHWNTLLTHREIHNTMRNLCFLQHTFFIHSHMEKPHTLYTQSYKHTHTQTHSYVHTDTRKVNTNTLDIDFSFEKFDFFWDAKQQQTVEQKMSLDGAQNTVTSQFNFPP